MIDCQGEILAIDDELIVLDLIKYNLENEGYSVDILNNVEDAFQADLSKYNLIIADVMMGTISGIEFANKLKQNPKTAHIPIIICTEKGLKADVINGLGTDIDDYIIKPLSMRELAARVRSILRRQSSTNKSNQ
jgi:DNA-binding response OmpR family regulator